MEPLPYTTEDFRQVARKQLITAASSALAESTLRDSELDALLYAARALCRDEIERGGRLSLHGLDQDADGNLVTADEAYLSVAAGDAGGAGEWLSLSYWLSDLALADRDPERVRAVVAAMERSLTKLNAWLAEQEPPADPAPKPRAKRKPKAESAPKPSAESPGS